jgi:hypothetical protein
MAFEACLDISMLLALANAEVVATILSSPEGAHQHRQLRHLRRKNDLGW